MAKTLYFQSAAATTHRGDNTAKLAGAASWWQPLLLSETRGGGAATATATSIAGTTVGIEFTSGSVALEWLSEPLSADFTISGSVTGNLWGLESTMNDNTAINIVVDKIDGATGAVTEIGRSARTTELGTTNGVNNFTLAPTSTACKRGDRLRVRPFIDDAGAAMIVGTSTFSYNGTTAAAAGDSYVQFAENLTFAPDGDPVVYSADYSVPTQGNSWKIQGAGGTEEAVAQSFVPSSSYTLARVTLSLGKTGTLTDNLVIEIQTDNGAGTAPSGTVFAAIATLTPAQVPVGPSNVALNVAIALTGGTKYWVVASRTGARDTANRYHWYRNNTSVYSTLGNTVQNSGVWAFGVEDMAAILEYVVTAPVYYLTDTAETINPGAAVEKKALTTRGSGSTNAVTNTAAGPTAPIQVTGSAGGTAVEWYTPALNAVTLGGKAKVNLRGLESAAAANASLCVQIAVCNSDGSSPVVWGKANIQSDLTLGGEVGTSDAAYTAWVAGDDVAVTAGQRLRFRVYVEDPAIGPLVTGQTVTVSYNGTTASAAGDTYVVLPVTVTEQSTGPTTWNGSATLTATAARTTAGTRTTFSAASLALTDAQTVAGTRKTFGSSTVPLTVAQTTAGTRKTFGSATLSATAAVTTNGVVLGAYPLAVLADGATFYYRLGETSGTAAVDAKGALPNGTYTGTYTLGQPGAINGDADKSYLQTASSTCVSIPQNTIHTTGFQSGFSVEAWIYPTADQGSDDGCIVNHILSGGAMPYLIGYGSNFGAVSGGQHVWCGVFNNAWATCTDPNNMALNQWHHIVFTCTGSSGTMRLYRNGVEVANAAQPLTVPNAVSALLIGQRGWSSTSFLGRIDEVAVYKGTVLTLAQVQAHYAAGTASAPITYYGSATVGLVVAPTTAATRRTFAAATAPFVVALTTVGRITAKASSTTALVASRTSTGTRRTFAFAATALTNTRTTAARITAKASATAAFVVSTTTTAIRKSFAVSTATLTATGVTAGVRRTFSAAVAAVVNLRTTAARITAFASAGVRSEAVAVTTSGQITGSIANVFGSATLVATALVTTSGTRRTFSSASASFTDTRTSTGKLTAKAASSAALTATRTTAAIRKTFAASTTTLVNARTTSGRITAKASTAVVLSNVRTTTGQSTIRTSSGVRSETVLIWTDGSVAGGVAATVAKRWNGSSWTTTTVRRWDGSTWQPATVKRRETGAWV